MPVRLMTVNEWLALGLPPRTIVIGSTPRPRPAKPQARSSDADALGFTTIGLEPSKTPSASDGKPSRRRK